VTGSVDERIAPNIIQSKKEILSCESIPVIENRYIKTPITKVEIIVPAKAKVRIEPKFRKKFFRCRS
jgi:hypothetical protein